MAAVPGMVPRKPTKASARPDAFGDSTKFEDDRRQWAQDHPDNKGKDPIPKYTPPAKKISSLGPGSVLKGTSAVHGMIARY